MKISISSGDAFGKAIAEKISELTQGIQSKTDAAVEIVAKQSLEKLKEKAAGRLYRTKDQYILGLKMDKVGSGIYSIVLDESAAHLENGYESYDMKKGLLYLGKDIPADKQGKIKTSKAGYRYRAIPFDHNQSTSSSNHPLHNTYVGTPGPALPGNLPATTVGSLGRDLKSMIKEAKIGGITKDNRGNPIMGAVSRITAHPEQKNALIHTDLSSGIQQTIQMQKEVDKRTLGMTKYQYEVKNRNGGTTVKSAYMTFRIVSEDPKYAQKWIHPGFAGIHAFKDVQRWAEDTLDRMITEIIKDYR